MRSPRNDVIAVPWSWPWPAGGRRAIALAALAGAVAALGQAPFDLWPPALLGFAVLFRLWCDAAAPRRAALIGWAGGTGYFLIALHWIVEPFLVDAARHGWMAPFALPLLAGGLALFWGLAFGLARALRRRPALLWILALTGAELLRSYIFTGFPWALVGHVLIASPFVQIASVTGPHGLSLLALSLAVALVWLTDPRQRRAAAGVFAMALVLLPWALWQAQSPAPAADAPVVRLVQPNAPQHEKWQHDLVPVFFRRQVAFTAAEAERRPDLVVWPETAVPLLLEDAAEALAVVAEAAAGAPVVLGIQRLDGMRIYNSAVRVDPDGAVGTVYDKHHLVPFGEYMPFGDLLARIGIYGLASAEGRGYSAGPGAQLMQIDGIGMALPLICYEAVFPNDVRAAPQRPRFLMQITNDAWFGKFSGPYQHLAQARLRAVEQGLPMVRVANTGVSAMIDGRGHVLSQIALGQAGWIDAALPPALAPTPYARSGDLPLALLIALVMAGFGLVRVTTIGSKAD